MDKERMYQALGLTALINGVSVKEVVTEIETAIADAYDRRGDLEGDPWSRVCFTGENPTMEDVFAFLVDECMKSPAVF